MRCMENKDSIPMLIPVNLDDFWLKVRDIIREEINRTPRGSTAPPVMMDVPGLTEKPLYKIQEVCTLFKVTKPTIYDWIKHGKLKRVKIRSRVYFLGNDIRQLMQV